MICVTETWLSDSIFVNETLPCHYSIYHNDRGSCGGGVLIAVDDCIPSSLNSCPSDLEAISIQLGVIHPITLSTVYVTPKCNDSCEALLSFLSDTSSAGNPSIIVGDFNLPDIHWPTLSAYLPTLL